MSGLLLYLVIATPLVVVEGGGDCPSAAAIQLRLQALLPDAGSAATPVKVTRREGELELQIGEGAGAYRRGLPMHASCAQREAVAATVIAAWESELQGALALPPETAAGSPAVSARREGTRVDVEAEVAFVGALAGASFAPGASAAVRLSPADWRLGFRAGLLGESTRELALGDGRASWGRSALTLGAGYRFSPGRLRIELRAGGALALLYVGGAGFGQSYQRYDVDVGLGAGVRAGVQAGPVQPFLSVEVIGWLRPEQAFAQHGDTSIAVDLPRFEVLLAAGLAFGRAR